MIWFKCCPYCGGDLFDNLDRYGTYISCFQCGRILSLAEEVVLMYVMRTRNTLPRQGISGSPFQGPQPFG